MFPIPDAVKYLLYSIIILFFFNLVISIFNMIILLS